MLGQSTPVATATRPALRRALAGARAAHRVPEPARRHYRVERVPRLQEALRHPEVLTQSFVPLF